MSQRKARAKAPPAAPSRGPSDADVMREMASIKTRLQLAFPGAEVDVVGMSAPDNTGLVWRLRVGKAGVTYEAFKKPDTPTDNAVAFFRKAFAEAAAFGEPVPRVAADRGDAFSRLTTRKRGRA